MQKRNDKSCRIKMAEKKGKVLFAFNVFLRLYLVAGMKSPTFWGIMFIVHRRNTYNNNTYMIKVVMGFST